MIEQIIVDKILEIQKIKAATIIAFCGAADLGKSFVANKVVCLLNRIPIESSHLTLDSFLMDRAERKKHKISGYDIRAHDTDQIVEALTNWRAGREISFRPYDHQTGTKSKNDLKIQAAKVLLIEGLFSVEERFQPFIDLSFFFYTDDAQLKTIKLEADLVKRNYTPEYAEEIYDHEFELYKKNIEPLKASTDFNLFLKYKWQYQLEE